MKPCPHCAEEIQDAAILCHHCGRDLTPRTMTPAAPRRGRGIVLGLLVVILVFLLTRLVAITKEQQRLSQVAAGDTPGLRPPMRIRVGDGKAFEIAAGAYHHYDFDLTNRACRYEGHIEVISGGNKDVELSCTRFSIRLPTEQGPALHT